MQDPLVIKKKKERYPAFLIKRKLDVQPKIKSKKRKGLDIMRTTNNDFYLF